MPTLLVIDDEESILHFFRRAFPGPEIRLVTAASAAEGVERVSRDRPDVIILDIDLPDQSGFRRDQAAAAPDRLPEIGRRNVPKLKLGRERWRHLHDLRLSRERRRAARPVPGPATAGAAPHAAPSPRSRS